MRRLKPLEWVVIGCIGLNLVTLVNRWGFPEPPATYTDAETLSIHELNKKLDERLTDREIELMKTQSQVIGLTSELMDTRKALDTLRRGAVMPEVERIPPQKLEMPAPEQVRPIFNRTAGKE